MTNGGGSGIIRNRDRVGFPIEPTQKDYEMALNPEHYAVTIAHKYRINLKGSGKKISLVYDETIGSGTYGKTFKDNPTVIHLGKDAFVSEEELANTIAHELNHCRSFLRGEDAPEETAYAAGNAISEYIRGER